MFTHTKAHLYARPQKYVNRRVKLVGRYIGRKVEGVPRGRVT